MSVLLLLSELHIFIHKVIELLPNIHNFALKSKQPQTFKITFMCDDYEYGNNAYDDMMTDYDYHVNTGELADMFDECVDDDFIDNLNDWD